MAQQGWYPDPGGQPGMFRYWDGANWSEVLSPTPLSGAPQQFGVNPTGYQGSSGYDPTQPLVTGQSYTPSSTDGAYNQYQTLTQTKAKKPVAMWVTIVVGVVVLGLIIWWVGSNFIGGPGPSPTTEPDPGTQPTMETCPKQNVKPERAEHPKGDGRVYGGALSYPEMGTPWDPVEFAENRVPFGRDVAYQNVLIHRYKTGQGSWNGWVASVLIGELYAGDGFYDPQKGSEIVNKCIFGEFYGKEHQVFSDTLRSEAYNLDGYDGWITETNLSFEIPGLETTSELAIVIIVKTSAMSSSLFYASIPNDAMYLKPDVDRAIAGLRVTE